MQDSITKALGLVNQFSPLSIQPGSLARGNNCVNQRENVYEDRRGYKVDAELAGNIKNVLTYSGTILAHHGTTISYGKGTYSNYAGSYTEPTGQRIRAAEAASNLYFTTDKGVKVFTDITGTAARSAGAPRCLDPSYELNAAGTGFLANGSQCAYRCTIQKTDANLNVITGYPSQRLWVVNSSGTAKNVDLTVYVPTEVAAGDIIQFYRTAQFVGTSDDLSGDEMALIYQYALTSTDITAGFITFVDSITDALRGATLYTSPSQEGISQGNDRPPLCNDISLFRSSYMFFANTKTRQRLFVTMVSANSLSGKTITLAGVTYNFGATEIISGVGAPQVKVSATGVVAVDIDVTARSLVRVINRYAGNTAVYAYYQSGPSDLPGQMVIEEKGIGASAFTLNASDAAISEMFYPAPPVSGSSLLSTSSNSVQKNALYYAKFQQNEHVPAANYLPVGPANKNILRIAALRESLIIIKEEGVYRLTGETPGSFTVTPLDLTVFCKAPESVAILSNQVLMLSNQGIVSITETGVSVISREIEPYLKPLLTNSSIADYTSAFSYESDRHYLISTITDPADTAATQTLVYNIFTRTWVRWTFAIRAGVIDPPTDKLYFCKDSDANVYQERKSFSNADYADPEIPITITAIDFTNRRVTFTASGRAPEVGWVIQQGSTSIAISSLSFLTGSYVATLESVLPDSWIAGDANIFPSVGMDFEWNPWTGGQPASLKQVRCVKFLADTTVNTNSVTQLYAVFTSNFDETEEEFELTQSSDSWGNGPWGNLPWGGGSDSYGYPTWVPRNKQYCTRLSVGLRHKKALEKVSICGVAFDFEISSDRIGR